MEQKNKKNNVEQVNRKELFYENGKLKSVKKKTAEEPPKNKPTSKKLEKEITAEQFIKQLNAQLGTTSKWDNYEHVIRIHGKVCAWVCDRQSYVLLSIFPPFNDSWKTIQIQSEGEIDDAIIMLKAKINGYKPKKLQED